MSPALLQQPSPVYRSLFPDWTGRRPFSFFLMENLLEARSSSFFPTNGAVPDEDVNVYLADALTRFFTGRIDPRVQSGMRPLLAPESKAIPRASRADRYRINGDHRLLFQGLFDRGDGLRRNRLYFGTDAAETGAMDRRAGAICYELAADLLEGRGAAPAGLVSVLRKLADHYDDYVHVVAVLATRKLGLGAQLTSADLNSLWSRETTVPTNTADATSSTLEVDQLIRASQTAGVDMDSLLDLLLEYHQTPTEALRMKLVQMAGDLGVDAESLVA